jgi:hypothetical protein
MTAATATAIHEAGHAVALVARGVPIEWVSIEPTADTLGRVEAALGDLDPESIAVSLLASGIAVRRLGYSGADPGDCYDRAHARGLASAYLRDPAQQQQWLETVGALACAYVTRHADGIRRVAHALDRRTRLTGAEVAALRPQD